MEHPLRASQPDLWVAGPAQVPRDAASRIRRIRSTAPLHERRGIEFRPLAARSVLNRNPNTAFPFYWTLNPYRGCEFGCRYCFARFTHEFLDHRRPDDFERRIYAKLDAAQVLAETVQPGTFRGRPLALGTATDPYQPIEGRLGITRRILEVLAGCSDLDLSVTTKSPMVLRDLDLLRRIAKRGRLRVQISLTTLHPGLARILEHRAPSPGRRLRTVRRLSEAGIFTVIFCAPILPWITDHPDDLRRLLRAGRTAGAIDARGGLLHLEPAPRKTLFPVLRRHFPHLWDSYRRLYSGGRLAPEAERERLRSDFARIRREAGFAEGTPEPPGPGPPAGTQLRLPF